MERNKIWSTPRINSWPTFSSLIYIQCGLNFLYADDTSIIVSNHDYNGYKLTMNKIFQEINMWFRDNLLKLSVKKHYLQFITMNHDDSDMNNNFSHKLPVSSRCTKFLGFNTDNQLSCYKIKLVMFYNEDHQTHNVSVESEDDLLCLYILHYNFLNYLLR
jgi:hypothetical protein